jgi:hypothetical protein
MQVNIRSKPTDKSFAPFLVESESVSFMQKIGYRYV